VSVDEGAASATTDAAGSFRLRVAAGDHRLRVSHPGYGAVARRVAVTADVALDLRLDPVYRLSEDVVVQAVRADARAPVTKKDVDRAEIEQAYYGQEMPYLLKQAPSITQ
ncbi:MAG: carboxypeptidase-like regulatory domain-containing protein, partial [Chloroflexi bacterium]